MKRVLSFAASATHLGTILPVTRLVAATGRYDPVIAIEGSPAMVATFAGRCADAGIECFDYEASADDIGGTVPDWPRSLVHHGQFGYAGHVARSVALARRTLDRIKPDVMLVPEETVGLLFSAAIVEAARRRVPTLIIPFTISTADEPAEALLHHSDYATHFSTEPRLNRWIARLFPGWVHEYKGRRILRWPALGIAAQWWYGVALPRPWAYNDGFAAALAVESERMRALYLSMGLPDGKLRVTGTLEDDRSGALQRDRDAERHRAATEAGLPLTTGEWLFVAAVPPRLDFAGRPALEFVDHRAMARAVAHALAEVPGARVLLSLHPALADEPWSDLEIPGRVAISPRPVADLIPLADLYVACASATIRSAIAAGVPVLNFDAYRFGYRDFDGVDGVTTFDRLATLADIRSRLVADTAGELGRMRRALAVSAPYWGLRDGHAGERIVGLVDELADRRPSTPAASPAVPCEAWPGSLYSFARAASVTLTRLMAFPLDCLEYTRARGLHGAWKGLVRRMREAPDRVEGRQPIDDLLAPLARVLMGERRR